MKAVENTLRIMAVKYERNLNYVKEFIQGFAYMFPSDASDSWSLFCVKIR